MIERIMFTTGKPIPLVCNKVKYILCNAGLELVAGISLCSCYCKIYPMVFIAAISGVKIQFHNLSLQLCVLGYMLKMEVPAAVEVLEWPMKITIKRQLG